MTHDNFMKTVIIAMAIFLLIFTVMMILCWFITGGVPDSLIVAVFAACLGEGSICGFLKGAKIKQDIEKEPDDEIDDKEEEDDGSSAVD